MALTSTQTLDVAGQTQTIQFYEGATLVDQIQYSSSGFTFSTISSFNLSKSDALLYFQYFNAFFNLALINFPTIQASANAIMPLCLFSINEYSAGVTHLTYTQTSQGNSVYTINYVPIASSASFSARSSVTISIPEFFTAVDFKRIFTTQISLN